MTSSTWQGPPLFSAVQARGLLALRPKGGGLAESSLDLGRTLCPVALDAEGVDVNSIRLTWKQVEKIAAEDRKVFRLDGDRPEGLKVFSETTGWLRSLCPTETAPTVLVGGFPMHRIKGTDPLRDTRSKIQALGAPKGPTLDTATGLGYTAIELARTASHVVTVEIDPGALDIARLNPWSSELFQLANIEIQPGDIAELILHFRDRTFDAVLHDPPTAALGGDLYALNFYRELRRILRPGGALFHYVGDPDSNYGRRMGPGIQKRLKEAGFRSIEPRPEAFGFTAR